MSSVEDRLNDLAKRLDALTARFDKLDEDRKTERLKDAEWFVKSDINHVILANSVEFIERYMQKWDEVYYRVFPERSAQDVRFEQQLHRLKHPERPEDGKAKS